jgi:nucleotide-binding universal stress UspA family protein
MNGTATQMRPTCTPTIGVGYVEGTAGREARMYAGVRATLPAGGATDLQGVEGERQLHLDQELARLVASFGDFVPVEINTFVGDPAQTLIDTSQNLDVLVCGSRGQGALRSAVLGSVSRRVTAEAHCPVLVLPPGVTAPLDRLCIGMANTPS